MLIIHHPDELSEPLLRFKNTNQTIGFFPTMGALHAGHISLLHAAQKQTDISVCSIFVNPTQFNNPDDLAKYPRTLEQDIALLENEGCDVLFLPETEELYALEKPMELEFGGLATYFEGASRPGHFSGVARVVRLFFVCVRPDHAFFGLKDFQQCMIIRSMTQQLKLPIQLHFEPTLREEDGLAMSSRNVRLSAEQRKTAPVIFKALQMAKQDFQAQSISVIEEAAKKLIEGHAGLRVDYFQLADARTLEPLETNDPQAEPVALAAVYAGDVRLIDNLLLK